MSQLLFALFGAALGAIAVYFLVDAKRRRVAEKLQEQEALAKQNQEQLKELSNREQKLNEERASFSKAHDAFNKSVISYKELQDENALLKQDLRNIAVTVRKTQLDRDLQDKSQADINQKVEEIGSRYLKDNVKWISNSLNANNFVQCKERLLDVIERCRSIGFQITPEEEATYVGDLKAEYEKAVRAEFEREQQARIKAQIREEQKLEREIQREKERIERERAVIEAALATALATAADIHSAEIESLKARLAEAEEKQRAISLAQITKAGFVYVISNIGSFGEGVYKIGMTRRREAKQRIYELGDASVPFPFDIHMLISCDNAPALENAIHRELFKQQVNKTNPRKEFFRTDIVRIANIVQEHHGEVEYTADAEALQYRQSLAMSDEDLKFIEHVYEELEEEDESFTEDLSKPVAS